MKAIPRTGRGARPGRQGLPRRGPRSQTRTIMTLAALAAVVLTTGAWTAAAAQTADASCQPGSGPHLAGKTLTSSRVSGYAPGHLRCADLTGSNLSGLSLIQIDMTGAILSGANLQHTDLTQATLSGADFSHADLSNATLDQATARGTNFTDANLTGVSAVQTDLTQAKLNGAKLGGVSFTQATLTGATFTGATGLTPWSTYLLLAAGVIFVLLALGTISRARRPGQGRWVPLGLLGCLVAAFGFHLFVGGLIDEFVGGFGPPVTQTCSGPQCAVGVNSGLVGVFAGIFVFLIGLALRRGRRPSVTTNFGGGAGFGGSGGTGFPGQGFPGQGFPGQGFPGQGVPGQGVPGQGVPGQGVPGQGFPGQPFPGGPGVPGTGGPTFPGTGGPTFPGSGGPTFPGDPGNPGNPT